MSLSEPTRRWSESDSKRPSLAQNPAFQARADACCDRFESAWKSGQRPRIEDFLTDLSPAEQEALLFELVPLEIEYRRLAGDSPTAEEYRSRFPGMDSRWLSRQCPSSVIVSDASASGETPFVPGTLLGDYELLEELGRGGMGTVHRARHRRMDRLVALKMLRAEAGNDPNLLKRFQREVRALAALSHLHIVTAHDAGEERGIHYLIMEYVDGGDLNRLVQQQGPLPVAWAVDFTIQAAVGLGYAHQRGVIHRDVKPHNLLLTQVVPETLRGQYPHGLIKILDLGLARVVPLLTETSLEQTRTNVVMGTAHYMAPEQAMSSRQADARSDIYSLGCMLHYLLTGQPIFAGENFLAIALAHQQKPAPSLRSRRPEVPEPLDRFYQRMTAKKPALRPQTMEQVIDELISIRSVPATADSPPALVGGQGYEPAPAPSAQQLSAKGSAETIAPPVRKADKGKTSRRRTPPLAKENEIHSASPISPNANSGFFRGRAKWGGLLLAAAVPALWLAAGWWKSGPAPQRTPPNGPNRPTLSPATNVPIAQTPIAPATPQRGSPPPLVVPTDAEQVRRIQDQWADYLGSEREVANSFGMTMVLVPPGNFLMGDDADPSASPAHPVEITAPFYVGRTEVTVAQFRQFAEAAGYRTDAERSSGWGVRQGRWVRENGFHWQDGGEQPLTPRHPAVNISWNDAAEFCRWLSQQENQRYRLPTEAEWEFACRAGSAGRWCFGSQPSPPQLARHAWYLANAGGRLQPVAQNEPNAFGLFDLHGNECEWCGDSFAPDFYSNAPRQDPRGPALAHNRLKRGGGMLDPPDRLGCAFRRWAGPSDPTNGGFRVVREIGPQIR